MDSAEAVDTTLPLNADSPTNDIEDRRRANGDQSSSVEDENKFRKAIAAWKNINLTKLVSDLDVTASDIITNQRDSALQRKELAQRTKDFRKLDDAGKLVEIKGLLKAYQSFIDLITNHGNSTRSAFLQIYSSLSDAPDPYPLLEASVDSLVIVEETLPKIQAENQHLQKTNSRLNSQLEEAEKRLEHERSRRHASEESRDAKIQELEMSWEAVLKEKQDNWQAKERSLEEKFENQDRLLKELRANYEVSQRLDKGENDEDGTARSAASTAELELLNSELERTNNRLAEVVARNEQLRFELAQAVSQRQNQPATAVEDDPAFLRLRSENSSLLRRLDSVKFEKDSEKNSSYERLRSLEREIASLKNDRERLQEKVEKWRDYEGLKRELEVLKSIEFAATEEALENDNAARTSDTTSTKYHETTSGKDSFETLEQLLLSRNKKLSNELTLLRVSHQDLQARLATLQEDLSSTNMELEKSRNLTVTLENDLSRVQDEASNAFPSSASVAGTYTSRYPGSNRRGRASSPTSSIISGFDRGSSLSSPGEPAGPGNSGILPMVTAQRDRFKKRNSELEKELSKTYETVTSLRSEIASLQKDNLNLYERSRYVSTFYRAPSTSASAYAPSPNPSTIEMGETSTQSPNERYKAAYESHISPFAAFRGLESMRALKRLRWPEKLVFRFTKLVLSTRTTRNLFGLYFLLLHVMVLVMLFGGSASGVGRNALMKGVDSGAVTFGKSEFGTVGGEQWQQEKFGEAA